MRARVLLPAALGGAATMNVKITPRQPEGVLVDLEGSEVKPNGKTTLSLSAEQFAKFTSLCSTHLERTPKREAKAPAEPIGKGRHP